MPNRNTHAIVGVGAGLVASAVSARHLPAEHRALEVLSGAIGGYVGGIAPDVLEPAVNPNHRDLFHSVMVGGAVSAAVIADWHASCRQWASECDARAVAAPIDSDLRRSEELKALLWRMAAGFLVGFVAGYMSHLALDAGTTRSVPLIACGF